MFPRGRDLVGREAAIPRSTCAIDRQPPENCMYACLHGPGILTALAFEFSPVVEQTAPDTVAFDVSGLDRLLGPVQDIAAAIMRRAAERSEEHTSELQSR